MGTQIVEVVELPSTVGFVWKIDNFSQLYLNNKGYHYSDVSIAAGAKWKVKIYPMGCGEVFDHLSMYLYREDSDNFPVSVKYSFAITSQTNSTNTKTVEGEKQFISTTADRAWGYLKILPLSQLHDSNKGLSKGYLVNDTCEIRIEITRKIATAAEKPVKQKGKHSSRAKSVKSNSGHSAITCIWCSCMTTRKIAAVAEKPVKQEGKQPIKEEAKQPIKEEGIKHLSRVKSDKSNSGYSATTTCTWFSCVTRH
ncbi:hypothetical protein MKX01_004145 [Papaver californicum]|nr:hypothetical protein MKX01_034264 [Papaver californicum]KAI3984437.1 hypothetical protein MKX01_004145 [Papaver californicum]